MKIKLSTQQLIQTSKYQILLKITYFERWLMEMDTYTCAKNTLKKTPVIYNSSEHIYKSAKNHSVYNWLHKEESLRS
jgi:hypothetical protein